ncbi:MAG: hypothetical protein ACFFBP_04675 [Promethearchaeota archaeon]
MIILLYSPILILTSIILVSTAFIFLIKKQPKYNLIYFIKLTTRLTGNVDNMNKTKRDSIRKINHILLFIGLILLWLICLIIIINITGSSSGMLPTNNNMVLIFIQLLLNVENRSEILFNFGWFYYLLLFFFYALFLLMITNEFTRKSKRFIFPFNFVSKFVLIGEEIDGYGSYLYFAIGHLFASFFCPPMIFLSILGMSSIGDLMASQIGIRYGKRTISWNHQKTWEGTITATITCFIICFFFIGIIWGIIFSISFLVFDTLTGKGFKKIDLSDNILIPIGCTIIFLIVRFVFNLSYYTIFLG